MLTRQHVCPCGTKQPYHECCGRFIDGASSAPTPEALMRSRYTAYTLANIGYIAKTMLPPAANDFDSISAKDFAEQAEWIKLDVLSSEMQEDEGRVEFVAHFIINGHPEVIHEKSLFKKIDGHWYYIDGEVNS